MRKKIFLLATLVALFVNTANAQFKKGNSVATAGLVSNLTASLPVLEGSYERFLTDQVSVGGVVGTHLNTFALYGGAKGSFHFLKTDKYDVYIGGKFGYLLGKSISSLLYTGHIGGYYFFKENMAINTELGYNYAPELKLGITFKL